MSSYEDRVRAVELFIKLGKRVRATIRPLGYATKNALKGWHLRFENKPNMCGKRDKGIPFTIEPQPI